MSEMQVTAATVRSAGDTMTWLDAEDKKFIQAEIKRYESPYSSIIPTLFRIQSKHGWVGPKAVVEFSEESGLPAAHINEVLWFYTMFNKQPVGKLHVQVCANVSCAMNGGREMAKHICNAFDVKEGEISQDGMVTVSKVECLGACDKAPMMQVNDKYYEGLEFDQAVKIIQDLAKSKGKK